MAEPMALAALAIDAALGWPPALYARIGHPVGLFARVIGWGERRWNRADLPDRARRLRGIATLALAAGIAAAGGWAIEAICRALLGGHAWLGIAFAAAPGLAQRSLYDHVLPVSRALAAGDLSAARAAVGRIVGRDTAALDEAGVARAAIESLAESFCDGIAAPLFWLLLLGLPGLWAYKAINTADSLIGHYEPRWRAFGWAAARTDDVANFVPARIAGATICLAGRGGWRIMARDAGNHTSPNAGWPEAAMAGALGLSLGGPAAYDGAVLDKPRIGDGCRQAGAADITRALRVYRRSCLTLWLVAGGMAWAL
ncbi:adenosylcobinamide-phosphate synthase CbiB [Sphingomonas quercus]|uniref:Cobalamin biosynthesis protein CobD n=1 Tax=Sphingomonas quercus TaxID=2842451 RepID=A0ABS6BNC2_9SPHN|nr:adenosylcobinamide-phosphate synthase CbiB [Sphingomonas quercus]MBU3078685.1 adenosylcobinamide-phosphate synthase CbiB [Sphingomonas quercus]